MPKKTPEPEQAPKADNYAKINMPAKSTKSRTGQDIAQ